jgi:hypothetical protein
MGSISGSPSPNPVSRLNQSLVCTNCWERFFDSCQLYDYLSGQSPFSGNDYFGNVLLLPAIASGERRLAVGQIRESSSEGCGLCKLILELNEGWTELGNSASIEIWMRFCEKPFPRLTLHASQDGPDRAEILGYFSIHSQEGKTTS